MIKHRYEEEQIKQIADKVSEKAIKEEFRVEAQRTLHLVRQHDLVGVLMKKAVERGEFDNLEGAGKPLNLEENPFEPVELHMVHKILKDNGYAPYWIELGKEIDTLGAKLDQEIDSFKKYTQIFFGEKRSSGAVNHYENKRRKFYMQIREHLEEISKKILDHNLHCPVSRLHRFNFDVNDRMNNIIKDIEKLINDPVIIHQ
jgi:hypothetical protein